jgi:gliding motility-associated-like protein
MANSVAYSGTYFLTASDAIGCVGTTSIAVTINGLPNISISALGPVTGCIPLCVQLACVTSSTIQTYNWNMGNGTSASTASVQSCYTTAGIYTVNTTVLDSNGCMNITTFTVQAYPIPHADFNYSPLKPIENTDNVLFTDASYGATVSSWSWYFTDNATNTSTLQNPNFLYANAGEYPIALVVKSNHGCSDTIVKSIVVGEDFSVFVPNSFTPNGDGLNDVFYAKGYGITAFNMVVYDRWGTLVFSSSDINAAWDGTMKGVAAKEDTYTWRITLTNVFGKSKDMTGHITLIR